MNFSSLFHRGFAHFPHFLEGKDLVSLNNDFDSLLEKGAFSEAKIGKNDSSQLNSKIRSDRISWVDLDFPSETSRILTPRLQAIQSELNRKFYLGLHDFEGHFALFPRGSHYNRHKDTFQSDDKRTLSFVLYLNRHWEDSFGGELQLYTNPPMKISPVGGSLILFMSREIEHEVLPSTQDRRSFTGWFRRRPANTAGF